MYDDFCDQCKEAGENYQFIGETGRSIGERLEEHWAQFSIGSDGSHILNHQKEIHDGSEEPRMTVKKVKKCRDALTRQVSETIHIKMLSKRGTKLLNSKVEYNRCLLHTLAVMGQGGKVNVEEDAGKHRKKLEELEKLGLEML